MEFERIGRNTVQCRMTPQEMDEYGLKIEDFLTDQEKVRGFLESLVERAEEEVGYEAEGGMVSMQLMRLPDDSLLITFSDRGEDSIHSMINQIQNMVDVMGNGETEDVEDLLDQMSASAELQPDMIEEQADTSKKKESSSKKNSQYEKHLKEVEKKRQEKLRQEMAAARVFCFARLNDVENFAQSLEMVKNIPSKLYKDKNTDKWYLLVKKGKLKLEEYDAMCQQVLEFGTLCSKQPYVEQYCKEHYSCIIGKQAIKAVKEYVG